MVIVSENNLLKIIEIIKHGAIVAIPTDTIYGLVCQFNDEVAIDKIYQIKNRSPEKPFAILVKDWEQAQKYGVFDRPLISYLMNNYVNGQITVIVYKQEWLNQFNYWKNKTTIAIRVTASNFVCELIKKTGPLIATSYNFTNDSPINDWQNAQKIPIDYFVKTNQIIKNKPSTVYDSINKKIIRE